MKRGSKILDSCKAATLAAKYAWFNFVEINLGFMVIFVDLLHWATPVTHLSRTPSTFKSNALSRIWTPLVPPFPSSLSNSNLHHSRVFHRKQKIVEENFDIVQANHHPNKRDLSGS